MMEIQQREPFEKGQNDEETQAEEDDIEENDDTEERVDTDENEEIKILERKGTREAIRDLETLENHTTIQLEKNHRKFSLQNKKSMVYCYVHILFL